MDDLTEDNIQAMYDMTYEIWVHGKVAVRLLKSEWCYVDQFGMRTIADNAAGRLAEYQMVDSRS